MQLFGGKSGAMIVKLLWATIYSMDSKLCSGELAILEISKYLLSFMLFSGKYSLLMLTPTR